MRTLVVSDLHLGGRSGADLLSRRGAPLEALLAALDGVERLVLLGDALELRHGPAREALERARPVLEALGRRAEEVVLVPGNHDHALIAPWLERAGRDAPAALALDQRIAPADASWIAAQVGQWLGPATTLSYPGIWVRDDVFATHGHYIDLHTTLPTFERLAAGLSLRVNGPLPARPSVADYEARLAPVYAWLDAAARWAGPGEHAPGGGSTAVSAYRAMTGGNGGRVHRARAAVLGTGFPIAVGAVNRAGLGPVRADLSGRALRLASLEAMHTVVERLGIGADHVLFGHSHRTGPLDGDDRVEWGRLVNTGSWVTGQGPSEPGGPDPYTPGGAVLVDAAGGAPRLLRLL